MEERMEERMASGGTSAFAGNFAAGKEYLRMTSAGEFQWKTSAAALALIKKQRKTPKRRGKIRPALSSPSLRENFQYDFMHFQSASESGGGIPPDNAGRMRNLHWLKEGQPL